MYFLVDYFEWIICCVGNDFISCFGIVDDCIDDVDIVLV